MTQISEPKFRSHALRKGRVSITNQIYSITAVTHERNHYFSDFNSARTLINILRSHEQTGDAYTLCFVVMPDHFHWLMQLQNQKDLSATIQSVKSMTSKRLGFPVWQKGFHDRAIRHEEDLVDIARYIVANPIRAGLVNSIKEYPHWDAIWLP
ncbi:MAG: transposase [Gammaproteobacteria bacterium]|jgi:REP element-mobilizing transposase RayT